MIAPGIRPATEADAAQVGRLVEAAYGHYVERLGMLPGPMTVDHREAIRGRLVSVAERDGAIVGVIVRGPTDEGFAIENVAVDPSWQGRGLGRAMIELAETEARREGFDSIYLYAHEGMTENLKLYARLGYAEYERRPMGGFALVFMSKRLD